MRAVLGDDEKATRLDNAIKQVLAEGTVRTYDMGGQSSTMDMAEAVRDML